MLLRLLGPVLGICCAVVATGCFDDSGSKHPCDACLECEECIEAAGGEAQCAAVLHASQRCVGDDVHWFDSCDVDEGLAETCPDNAECVEPSATTAECSCLNSWQGEDCDVCPDNWDADQDCGECANNWQGDDCEDCPGNWDPDQNCGECVGGFDEATDCAECANNWQGDDCDVCPGNWDPSQDCGACVNQWTGDDCEICPGNWDPDEDCAQCLGNWDIADDCESCLDGWRGDDCEICVRYVDQDATGDADGLSWQDAEAEIQEGIDAAYLAVQDDDSVDFCEVWVAGGTHYVYEWFQADTILLSSAVRLYGSFAGDESDPDDRDLGDGPTTELNGRQSATSSLRVYHVVTAEDDTWIDGFTITQGNADGPWAEDTSDGGGMYIYEANVQIRNCLFTDNHAGSGGAIYTHGGSIHVVDCDFVGNDAGSGGAMYLNFDAPQIERCRFLNNEATGDGGAIYNWMHSGIIQNCIFYQNQVGSGDDGGGVHNYTSHVSVYNCTFIDNDAPTISNVYGTPTYYNNIIWGTSTYQIDEFDSASSFSYCDIHGGFEGVMNFDEDPDLVNPAGGDFQLQSYSPCIDAAHGDFAPTTDYAGEERIDDPDTPNTGTGSPSYADIGALEFQP